MPTGLLVSVTGRDRPGVTSGLFEVLAGHGAVVLDLEQVVVRERLLLGILIDAVADGLALRDAVAARADELGVRVDFLPLADPGLDADPPLRHHVTVLAEALPSAVVAAVAGTIADCGANIERITRLSRYPLLTVDLVVSGGDGDRLRADLSRQAAALAVDVAVQRASLYRRAKRLVVLDVDSTLVQGEVIEMLAAEAGCEAEVARVTAAAMAGELDFEASLRARVRLLAGLPWDAVERVRDGVRLMPGARTLVRTLRRLGYGVAVVSGGFTVVTDALAADLGLDAAEANVLEVRDGRLTGEVVGRVVDRAAKADALRRYAAAAGVPLSQTVAVGDGANDLDMLAAAGLGIAFNAKPLVREAADAAVSVPYLDAVLFLLGLSREEVEAADREDTGATDDPPGRLVPVTAAVEE